MIFLATDIEGSTELWDRFGPEMSALLSRHDRTIDQALAHHGGERVKHTGDGIFAIFPAGDPLAAALEIQCSLAAQNWGPVGDLRVRLAIHAGPAEVRHGDYFGLEVNRTFRLLSAAWGGQVLLTDLAAGLPLPAGASLLDHGVHLLRDLHEPIRLWELRHPDLPVQSFPPLRTLTARPGNLPPQPTPFVGRAADLERIAARLTDPACRLLTLLGPGGMGKTRLALQVAANRLDDYPHGAYFVPLAPLQTSERLVPAIAEALHLSFYSREHQTPTGQLINYLRQKDLLLVLDNFEHVVDGAALVAELLAAAPRLKVLVTSRERLNLQAESIYDVAGMAFPPDGDPYDPERHSALKLFLQAAARARAEFSPTGEDWPAIRRICHLLDGMPLGIELAAAWVRQLTCAEIAAEIESGLDFLTTTRRDVPERHRSLRAAFEYSWRLLEADEQAIYSRLSVFRGPFDRAAARQVAGASLPALTALVDQSLVIRDAAGLYHLHAALRQYAGEKLAAAGPAAAGQATAEPAELSARDRHCEFHLVALAGQQAGLLGAGQIASLAWIEARIDDLTAAWDWAVLRDRAALLTAALEPLYLFYVIRSRFQEGAQVLEASAAALARRPAAGPRLLLRIDLYRVDLYIEQGRPEEAHRLMDAALPAARRIAAGPDGDPVVLHRALHDSGRIARLAGEYARAEALVDEALEIATAAGDPRGQAQTLMEQGNMDWSTGNFSRARQRLEAGLALSRILGDNVQTALALDRLAVVNRELSDYATAYGCLNESLNILLPLGSKARLAYVYNHLGSLAWYVGKMDEVQSYLEESLRLAQEVGEQRLLAFSSADLGGLLAGNGQAAQGRERYEVALALFTAMGDPFGIIYAHLGIGDCCRALGELDRAAHHLTTSLQVTVETGAEVLLPMLLFSLAELSVARGELVWAVELLGLALHRSGPTGRFTRDVQAQLDELRPRLGEAEFAAALARGEGLGVEEVLDRERELDRE